MAEPKKPEPVKLFIGVLTSAVSLLVDAKNTLESEYGVVDLESDTWDFTFTDYYEEEMGRGLKRVFWSFEKLIDPSAIVDIKLRANAIEKEIAERADAVVSRPINLDPGYIAMSKLVLATTKDFSHRIYLRDGIYAEITLSFRRGAWDFWPWTYPDYRTDEYRRFFLKVRERFAREKRK